ncbi:MAG: hypothetical protein ABJA49_06750 [Betaproteobacteria bacterium]
MLRANVLECVQALDQLHAMQVAPRAAAQPQHEVFHDTLGQGGGVYPCDCLLIGAS